MSYFGSIYADQDLSHRARTVYMYLKDRSDAGNTCWPSVRRIAEDLKLSRRTVQRALTDLERHGFLERTHRRRPNGSLTSNLYRVKCAEKERTSHPGGGAQKWGPRKVVRLCGERRRSGMSAPSHLRLGARYAACVDDVARVASPWRTQKDSLYRRY